MSEPAPSRKLVGDAVLRDPLVRELLAMRLVAVLATLEPDGSVHAVPMWLAPGDGAILLATGARSRKVRNLERDPRATLVVHDSRPGAEVCGASLRGRVELLRGDDAAAAIRMVHRRYVGDARDRLPEVDAFLSSDDVAFRFLPGAAFTWDERGSDAARALRASAAAFPLELTSPRNRAE
ncbi:MAG: pyridoxamine 5'-phosphate oxidase family protein [Gaiellaceae bacterium]